MPGVDSMVAAGSMLEVDSHPEAEDSIQVEEPVLAVDSGLAEDSHPGAVCTPAGSRFPALHVGISTLTGAFIPDVIETLTTGDALATTITMDSGSHLIPTGIPTPMGIRTPTDGMAVRFGIGKIRPTTRGTALPMRITMPSIRLLPR